MTPLFSVILPTYNRARMARTALETVLWQSLPDWECLIVDDGSTDDTPALLASYKGDSRVRVFTAKRNQGMNASRNWAIQEARGRFVTFLDSDDLWLPGRLKAFADRGAGGFLYSNAWVWRNGKIQGRLFDPGRELPEGVVPGSWAVGDAKIPYVTTNVAVEREAFSKHGLFRTDMKTLDTELFARFLAAGVPVAALRQAHSVRRLHGEQLTGRHEENFKESLLAIAASGASEAEKEELRRRTAAEVGLYMAKAGRPAEARAFLLSELGDSAKKTEAWGLSALPAPLLRAGRRLKQFAMSLRPETPEEREVSKLIAPLLAREAE